MNAMYRLRDVQHILCSSQGLRVQNVIELLPENMKRLRREEFEKVRARAHLGSWLKANDEVLTWFRIREADKVSQIGRDLTRIRTAYNQREDEADKRKEAERERVKEAAARWLRDSKPQGYEVPEMKRYEPIGGDGFEKLMNTRQVVIDIYLEWSEQENTLDRDCRHSFMAGYYKGKQSTFDEDYA